MATLPNPKKWLNSLVKFDKNGRPIFLRYPTAAEIASISRTTPDGIATLSLLKVFLGSENAMGILSRVAKQTELFVGITATSPLYKGQLANMVLAVNSKANVVANARKTVQQVQTNVGFGTNPNQRGVYINEGDDPCDPCLALNGTVDTYQGFIGSNSMPTDQCLGQDNCLCQIVPFNE